MFYYFDKTPYRETPTVTSFPGFPPSWQFELGTWQPPPPVRLHQ